jgi:hypothetical protein
MPSEFDIPREAQRESLEIVRRMYREHVPEDDPRMIDAMKAWKKARARFARILVNGGGG